LTEHDEMLAWLKRARLTMDEYCEILVDWQAVLQLEDLYADAIARQLAGQRAFASMQDRSR
jgi:hypothetical protein